jgi:hypothetical protein
MGCRLDPPFYHCMNQYLPLLQQIETCYKMRRSIFIAGMKYGNGKAEAQNYKLEPNSECRSKDLYASDHTMERIIEQFKKLCRVPFKIIFFSSAP